MPTTSTGVSFTDFWEGYQETFSRGGTKFTRLCQVDWNQRFTFIKGMIGFSTLGAPLANNANSTIHRYLPDQFPAADGSTVSTNVYAVSAELQDVIGVPDQAGVRQMIDYTASSGKVRYRVAYEPLNYAVMSDDDGLNTTELNRYVTKTWQPTIETLMIQGHLFKFTTGNVKITAPLPKMLEGAEVQYSWWDVPASVTDGQVYLPGVLSSNISDCVGRVNDAAWDSSLWGTKTLLCMPPRIEPTFNAGGFPSYNIHYKFLWKPNGWHKVYRPKTSPPSFDTVVANSDGTTEMYDTEDFDILFQTA